MSKEQILKKKQELFVKEGGKEGKKRIFLVNPNLFRKIKYMTVVDAESLLPKNPALEQAISLEAYDRAIANPLIAQDVEALTNVTKDLLLGALRATKNNAEKYLPKIAPQLLPQPGESPKSSIVGQIAKGQESPAGRSPLTISR